MECCEVNNTKTRPQCAAGKAAWLPAVLGALALLAGLWWAAPTVVQAGPNSVAYVLAGAPGSGTLDAPADPYPSMAAALTALDAGGLSGVEGRIVFQSNYGTEGEPKKENWAIGKILKLTINTGGYGVFVQHNGANSSLSIEGLLRAEGGGTLVLDALDTHTIYVAVNGAAGGGIETAEGTSFHLKAPAVTATGGAQVSLGAVTTSSHANVSGKNAGFGASGSGTSVKVSGAVGSTTSQGSVSTFLAEGGATAQLGSVWNAGDSQRGVHATGAGSKITLKGPVTAQGTGGNLLKAAGGGEIDATGVDLEVNTQNIDAVYAIDAGSKVTVGNILVTAQDGKAIAAIKGARVTAGNITGTVANTGPGVAADGAGTTDLPVVTVKNVTWAATNPADGPLHAMEGGSITVNGRVQSATGVAYLQDEGVAARGSLVTVNGTATAGDATNYAYFGDVAFPGNPITHPRSAGVQGTGVDADYLVWTEADVPGTKLRVLNKPPDPLPGVDNEPEAEPTVAATSSAPAPVASPQTADGQSMAAWALLAAFAALAALCGFGGALCPWQGPFAGWRLAWQKWGKALKVVYIFQNSKHIPQITQNRGGTGHE